MAGVLFVVGLSDYDSVTFEDEETLCIHESLNVFEEQINNRFFENSQFFLIFNKIDLFEQRIRIDKVPITGAFPKYNGALNDTKASLDYIKQQFLSKLGENSNRKVHVYQTNALNKQSVMNAFEQIQDITSRHVMKHYY